MSEVSPEKQPRFRRARNRFLAGAIGLGFLFLGSKLVLDDPGEHSKFWPDSQPNIEASANYKVGTWNLHREDRTRQIGKLFTQESFDALMLQEITKVDAKKINQRYPDLYSTFVLGDALNRPHKGGTGNAIVTELQPSGVRTIDIEGSSDGQTLIGMLGGARADIEKLDTKLTDTKSGRQEPRSALALRAPLGPDQEGGEADLLTGHIAADPQVHFSQHNKFFDYVEQETSQDTPAIVCGDFNPHSEGEVPQAFADLEGFITVDTEPTNGQDYPVDVCAYNEAGVLGYHTDSGVMPEYSTDHSLAYVEWNVGNN